MKEKNSKIIHFNLAKICLLLILILNFEASSFYVNVSGSVPSKEFPYALEWQRKWNVEGEDQAKFIAIDKIKGDIYVSGLSSYFVPGPLNDVSDIFLIKVNKYGEQNWSKIWNPNYDIYKPMGMVIDSHHNIYLAVNKYPNSKSPEYVCTILLKYTCSGGLQFDKILHGSDYNNCRYIENFGGYNPYWLGQMDMKIDTTNSLYFASSSIHYNNNLLDSVKIIINKFNFEGGSHWRREWSGPSGVDIYGIYHLLAFGNLIALDSDGNSYTAGVIEIKYFSSYLNFKCLIKFNKEGFFQWSKIWGGNSYDNSISRDIAIDSGNNIYLLGISSLDKFDSNGNLCWSRYGVYENKIVTDSKNNVYVLGSSLTKYDSIGRFKWKIENVNGRSMDIDSDDNLYVLENLDNDVLVSKYSVDSDGDGVSDWQEKIIYFTSPTSAISNPLFYSVIFAIGGLMCLCFIVKFTKKSRKKKNLSI